MSEESSTPLAEVQQTLASHVTAVTKLSERGVLTAGDRLQAIVTSSDSHRREVSDTLTSLEDGPQQELSGALVEQGEGLHALHDELTSILDDRVELLNTCDPLVRDLRRQAQRLDEIAGASQILTLLARVEAAHIGKDGERFVWTVEEMAALDQATRKLTRDLVQLQERMRTAMPEFIEGTAALREHNDQHHAALAESAIAVSDASDSFRQDTQQAVQETREGAEALRAASLRALSALQFQDPLVQDLQQLDVQIARVRTQVEGEAEVGTAAWEANIGMSAFAEDQAADGADAEDDEDELDAGDFLMF